MPNYAYASVLKAATPSDSPKEWPIAWPYPLPDDGPWADPDAPWPPGWPIPPEDPDNPGDTYTVNVTIPATLDASAQSVLANVFTQAPAPAAFMEHHMMRLDATLDGVTVGIKKVPGGAFQAMIFYEITQHDGVNYGISESMYYDVEAADHGKLIEMTASVATVALPWPAGSDNGLVDVDCPADCTLCGDTLTGVVAGMTGGCPGGHNCANLNGTYVMTKAAGACEWRTDNPGGSKPGPAPVAVIRCIAQVWEFYTPTFGCFKFTGQNLTGCPPTGPWAWVSAYTSCTAGTATIS